MIADSPILAAILDNDEWETGEPPARHQHVYAEPMSMFATSGDPDHHRYGHANVLPSIGRRKIHEPLDDDIDGALIAAVYERQARFWNNA